MFSLYYISQGILQQQPEFENRSSPAEIGNDFLHDLVNDEIEEITRCIREYGKAACVYAASDTERYVNSRILSAMIKHSCYSVFIAEALKFIPRVSSFLNLFLFSILERLLQPKFYFRTSLASFQVTL